VVVSWRGVNGRDIGGWERGNGNKPVEWSGQNTTQVFGKKMLAMGNG